jgi:DNA-binding FadR family transcriptional regulator
MTAILDDLRTGVDTSSLVDRVEQNLVRLLQERKLRAGDSIPTELELAEALGVSRTVVREALLRLRVMGLVESKKKKGAVITNPDVFGTLARSLNPYILSEDTLREMFEIRLVLEIGMADFLHQRKTPADIAALREIVRDEPPATKHYLFNIEHEIRFHGKLYEITGNETMKKFQRLLLPIFDYVHHSGMLRKLSGQMPFVSHSDLVDILETGTADDFRLGMRRHLDSHFVRLFG